MHATMTNFPPIMNPIAVVLIVVIITTLFFFHRRSNDKKYSNPSPPSPFGLPIIGNLHQFGRLPHRSLAELAKKYGDVMLLRMGSVPTVVISSPEAAKEVLKTQGINFASRPSSVVTDAIFYGGKDIGSAKYGEYWQQIRRLTVLHLLSSKRVQSFKSIREEEAAIVLENLSKVARGEDEGDGEVNMSEILFAFANDVVCRVAFGRRYFDGDESRFKALLREFMESLAALPARDFIPVVGGWVDRLNGLDKKVKRVARELDDFLDMVLEEHVNKRREEENYMDFVDFLLSLNEEKDSMGNKFSFDRECIKAIISDILAGGTNTTYTLLEWTMAELIKHPKEMQRVQDELRREITNSKNELIVAEEIMKKSSFVYLKAVIKEALRLHPPGPLLIPRESIEDAIIKEYRVESGTRVMINAWAIGRDPKYWENPDNFSPQRFIDSGIDFKGLDFQFIPFGAGIIVQELVLQWQL